jgi:L,D-peptidoglycan transpeptidase YkuD (ErfK/YbiS/YcfS/YnhG family)
MQDEIDEATIISDAPEEKEKTASIKIDNADTIEGKEIKANESQEMANENQEKANDNQEKANDNQDLADIIFKETSETVYATANVNIRSAYTTNEDNILTVLKKGNKVKRIGLQEEWSKVLYKDEICYIKTIYLTLKKPVADKTKVQEKEEVKELTMETPDISQKDKTEVPFSDESFVAGLAVASKIKQLVCVIGDGGSDCTVSFHIKDKNGKWEQQFSVDGDNGSKGISYHKKEGDKKTPAGLFIFTLAFGIKSDPGALLPYRQITDYDYWIDDIESPDYNTWINSQQKPEYSYEHLIEHNPSYNYAMNINYNPDCTPGLGSAVFLHCYNGLGSTTGCIAISEKAMKTLIQEVDSSAMILIVPSKADLVNY